MCKAILILVDIHFELKLFTSHKQTSNKVGTDISCQKLFQFSYSPKSQRFIKSLNFNNFTFILYGVRVRSSRKMCVPLEMDAYGYSVNFRLIIAALNFDR